MSRREPQIMDHEYDGIQEFDNPTPGWWHLIFIGTVFFSCFYYFFWHYSPLAPTIHDSWRAAQVAEFKRVFGALGDLKPDEATLLRMMKDEKMMAVAQGIFVGNCAQCHGREGGGINGVNLTDNHYKNVKQLADVYTVVTKGANVGAMPAWENRLSQNERIIVSAYAATLRGRSAPGRPPEGEVIPPWPSK